MYVGRPWLVVSLSVINTMSALINVVGMACTKKTLNECCNDSFYSMILTHAQRARRSEVESSDIDDIDDIDDGDDFDDIYDIHSEFLKGVWADEAEISASFLSNLKCLPNVPNMTQIGSLKVKNDGKFHLVALGPTCDHPIPSNANESLSFAKIRKVKDMGSSLIILI